MTTGGRRRRDLILQAAAELFARDGFAGTGIDQIGAAAGISGPGVYRYFVSKDEILKTLVQEAAERLLTTTEPSPLGLDEPPAVTLARFATALVDDAMEHGAVAAVVWHEGRSLAEDARAWLNRLHRLRSAEWVHVLSRLRPGASDIELLTLVNGVHGMVIEAATNDTGLGRDRTRQILVEMIMRILVPATPKATPRRGLARSA